MVANSKSNIEKTNNLVEDIFYIVPILARQDERLGQHEYRAISWSSDEI